MWKPRRALLARRSRRSCRAPPGYPALGLVRRRPGGAEAYLDTLIYQLIDARRVQGGEKGDVLTMLLDARTEDGRPLSPRQIHDEALTLLLAGHETTALALSWTWYSWPNIPTSTR